MKANNIDRSFSQMSSVSNKRAYAAKKKDDVLPSDSFMKMNSQTSGIDLQKAASILKKTNTLKGKQAWKKETDLRFTACPVKGKGDLAYVASINSVGREGSNRLLALDVNTGDTKWEFNTNGGSRAPVAIGPDGTVYAGCYKSGIFAIDGHTGAQKWNFIGDGRGFGMTPTLGKNNVLYAGSPGGKIYAVNMSSGKKVWDFQTDNEVYSAPALGKRNTLFVGSYDEKVYALDASTGKEKWSVDTKGRIFADMVYGPDDTVYAGSGNRLIALDGKDGSEKWSYETGDSAGTPVLSKDGVLYFGDMGGGVYAVDAKNGKELWTKKYNGMTREKPVLTPQGELFITAEGKLHVFDAKTGRPKWEFDTQEQSMAGVSVGSDGKAYLATEKKSIFAIQACDMEDFVENETETEAEEGKEPKKERQQDPMEIKMGDGVVEIGGIKLKVNKKAD